MVRNYLATELKMKYKAAVAKKENSADIEWSLSRIEQTLSLAIRAGIAAKLKGQSLAQHIKGYVRWVLADGNIVEKAFSEFVEKTSFVDNIVRLIEQYGNGVWTHVVVSALAALVLEAVKPDIIVTYPRVPGNPALGAPLSEG